MMQNEPVSIVLPTYNRAGELRAAIESIQRQTYAAFELLVIDDGSTDDTEIVVRAYQERDSRIIYEKLEMNGGQSRARNYGMKMARYDYIAFEDSDDCWRPDKLQKQMGLLQKETDQTGFVYCKLRYDMGEGRYFVLPNENIPSVQKKGDIYRQLLFDNLVGMPTLVVRKECVDAIGYLDETLHSLEDYDFALRLAKKYHAAFVDEVLLDASFSCEGVSGDSMQYLIASCMILGRYRQDYLATGAFDHRVEIILRDAERMGVRSQIVQMLEKILSM